MRKFISSLIMAGLLSISGIALAIDRNSDIAIMDFGTRPGASEAEINVNNAEYVTSEYIIDRLVDDKCFQVKEKDFVMEQINAADISTVGIIDPDTAKRIGKMLNVRYILCGNVANVSLSETGGGLGGTGLTKNTVQAHIVGRVMDTETGSILYMVKGTGKSASTYTKVKGIVGGTLAFGTVQVTQDSVHNAIQKAAYAMVDELNKKIK